MKTEKIIMKPGMGAKIDDCLKEAIHTALHETCDVEFTHNALKVVVKIDDIMDIKRYCKTK